MYHSTGRFKLASGMLKIVVNGKQKIVINSSIILRRPRMIKKIMGVMCWPWKKFIKWLASGLPKK
jgi:hypothetical protein